LKQEQFYLLTVTHWYSKVSCEPDWMSGIPRGTWKENLGVISKSEFEEVAGNDMDEIEKLAELLDGEKGDLQTGGVFIPKESLSENKKGEKVKILPGNIKIKVSEGHEGIIINLERLPKISPQQLE